LASQSILELAQRGWVEVDRPPDAQHLNPVFPDIFAQLARRDVEIGGDLV
jgi:hypothetical protein